MGDGSFVKSIQSGKRKLVVQDGEGSAATLLFRGGSDLLIRLQTERSFSLLRRIVPANLDVLDKYFPFVSAGG